MLPNACVQRPAAADATILPQRVPAGPLQHIVGQHLGFKL